MPTFALEQIEGQRSARRGRASERLFNEALARALQQTSARWKGSSDDWFLVEQTNTLEESASLCPDILLRDEELPPLVIETSYQGTDADGDAEARLGKKTISDGLEINTALAVWIPARFRNLSVKESTEALYAHALKYALFQRLPSAGDTRRFPTGGYLEGTVFDLSALLTAAVLPKEWVDVETDEVAKMVEQAAARLERGLSQARQLELASVVYQRTPLKGLRTTMVLWLNALLTQQRLYRQEVAGIPALPFADLQVDPVAQARVWRAILALNWRSIFEPAVDVLDRSLGMDLRATADSLGLLMQAVRRMELARLGPHVHVGAELFPKLSEDRKRAAAFYTQPPTAELLAGLTIRPSDLSANEWQCEDLFRRHFLGDLACGTGTLLRAGYRRVQALHERAGGDLASVRGLHRGAMETGLVGTDVSPIATHLSSSSLAAIGLGEPYGDTKIGWVDVGGSDGTIAGVKTGALEFFGANAIGDLFTQQFGQSTGAAQGGDVTKHSVVVEAYSLDWVLMNPPYSRTRGGQSAFDIGGLSPAERRACQTRWGQLVRGEPVNRKAGMAASFLALASKKVKYGGRIGFVLPLTAAFADSWAITRKMIERDFEDITAVVVSAGQALGKKALSADTNMEEMLLVAKRRRLEDTQREGGDAPAPIHCATLRRPPARLGEAGEIARAILVALEGIGGAGSTRPIFLGDEEIGHIAVFAAGGEGAPWGPLGVVHSELAFLDDALCRGTLHPIGKAPIALGVEMATIDEVFDVGPTHHIIGHLRGNAPIGAFEFYPVRSSSDAIGTDRALWAADSKTQYQLLVDPTHKGSTIRDGGSDQFREDMRRRSGTLFYARGLRWTSQALLATMTRFPAMGGRSWTSLGHVDERVCRAGALWFNATFGLLIQWTRGQRTQTGRSTVQIGAIKKIPCPRLDTLDDAALNRASEAFNRLSAKPLRPTCQSHADAARHEIDAAVADMLGLHPSILNDLEVLRRLWCEEPSVHGNNQTALRLLEETA